MYLSILKKCLFFMCLLVMGCAGPILVSKPGTSEPTGKKRDKEHTPPEPSRVPGGSSRVLSGSSRVVRQKEIDFAKAFEDTFDTPPADTVRAVRPPSQVVSVRHPSFPVATRTVRIAIRENLAGAAVLYSVGVIAIHGARGDTLPLCRGRISLIRDPKKNNEARVSAAWGERSISLPCTLLSTNDYNFFEAFEESYRGKIVLAPAGKDRITVINHLDVEEYLRGVVPLEIGRRREGELEALKAQAVAARTYTYKKLRERTGQVYDLVNTVADQVYGGAQVEYRESDLAIKLTRDLILVYETAVVDAYYHSTCGGKTANIQDVWDKPQAPYLRSVNDYNDLGQPWCASSPMFSWEETWTGGQFSTLLAKYYRTVYPNKEFKGVVTAIRVTQRFACDRVKSCSIASTEATYETGGDKVRMVVRRNTPERGILRSSRFTVVSANPGKINIKGTGYGHGVGMCQFGAIGRSRAGQTFEQILKAYYSGVEIRTVVVGK